LYAEKRTFVDILGAACLIVDEISLFPEESVGIIARVASPVRKFQTCDHAWIKLDSESGQRSIKLGRACTSMAETYGDQTSHLVGREIL
jgi:hypothetical protein